MAIKCFAIDDEPPALELVTKYIERTPFLELVGAYNDPIEALGAIKKSEAVLVFLDINMPGITGMQLSRLLPDRCKVIFSTAYEEYALESYRVAALDYLMKPFSYEEFLSAASKANDYFTLNSEENEGKSSKPETFMFVKSEYKLHKVYFEKIMFVENIKDYIRIHLKDSTKLMVLMSLKSLEESLPGNFMKVHRSFIINLDTVEIVERGRIVYGNKYVPVSDRYKEEFHNFLDGRSIK